MEKWHLIIDIEKCEDCNNCFMACKDEYVDNDFPPYSVSQPRHGQRWMNIMRKERGAGSLMDVAYRPTPCMHCDDAPCVKASTDSAIYKREDGIVIIDPIKSAGKTELQNACPYHAIWWNVEKGIPQKCTFCAHLLDEGWKAPRCVQACATGALRAVLKEGVEMQQMVKSEDLEPLHPEYKTKPRVYYKNLHRYTSCFIAGSVVVEKEGVLDCAKGAQVALTKGRKRLSSVIADAFGDFKFDGLYPTSEAYQLTVEFEGFQTVSMDVDLSDSVVAPDIVFRI